MIGSWIEKLKKIVFGRYRMSKKVEQYLCRPGQDLMITGG
jgi:phosphate uptake regulator